MKDGTHNLHLPNKDAGAKKAPRTAVTGKMSTTELLRVYFVRPYPKFPTIADVKITMPTVSESRIKAVSASVRRTLRTAERLGKLKK